MKKKTMRCLPWTLECLPPYALRVIFLESERPYAIVILYLLPHEHHATKLLKLHCFLLLGGVLFFTF
jgi:hypothetical protein